MTDYEVGPGIADQMAANGDHAIMDSDFLTVEIGYGAKARYVAQQTVRGEWAIDVKPWEDAATDPAVGIQDYRDRLPTRAGSTSYPTRSLAGVTLFVAHYTAGPPTATVEAVASYQTGAGSHLAFPALAYHYYVEESGAVYWCHDLNRRTWGSGGTYQGRAVNDIAVHCCYAGNVAPNDAQIAGMRAARRHAEAPLGRALVVRGHRDDDATTCPGATFAQWKSQI